MTPYVILICTTILSFYYNKVYCMMNFNGVERVIDCHTHIWSDGKPPLSYSIQPPVDLISSQAEELDKKCVSSGISRVILIQPINHRFDHRYIMSVINNNIKFKTKFFGVCLMDPSLTIPEGQQYLTSLKQQGFIGVRFNPYLWDEGEAMSNQRGQAFYKHAGELNMPVGFMCFRGLRHHIDEIKSLLEHCPNTVAVIDHFGFFLQNFTIENQSWEQLLSLADYPQVYVKVSALFRLSTEPWPYLDLDLKLIQLVNKFGSDRLMFGSDYPFVEQLEGGYEQIVQAMSHWPESQRMLTQQDWDAIYRQTAENVYLKI